MAPIIKSGFWILKSSFRLIPVRQLATVRSNIAANIAKNFENIPLVDFPLKKSEKFSLSMYSEIELAHQRCKIERLDDNPNYYPSVTTILNKTMSPQSLAALKKWEADKIKELGLEGFERYRKEIFTRGRNLHRNIEIYLENRDTSQLKFYTKIQENLWKSIEPILPDIGKIYASEYSVHHPILKFRGILDCLGLYHGIPAVIEWKTSEKLRPTLAQTYDNPLQAIAYFSCLQFSDTIDIINEDVPNIQEVILIVAYENGTDADVHLIAPVQRNNLWKKFLKRLEQYWLKASTNFE